MEFVLNKDVYSMLEQLSLKNFNFLSMNNHALCKLMLLGSLPKSNNADDVIHLLSELIKYTQLCILYFKPRSISPEYVVKVILSCTRIHDDLIAYVLRHVHACLDILDHDMLIRLTRIHSPKFESVYSNQDYRELTSDYIYLNHPLHEFLIPALKRGYGKYHKTMFPYWLVKGIPTAVQFIPDNNLSEFLNDKIRVITEALNYRKIPSGILINLLETRSIIPYNEGLLDITDPKIIGNVVMHFMKHPSIDFSRFVDKETFNNHIVADVLIQNMCKHVSKPIIRECLLNNYSHTELRRILGLKFYTCVATEEEADNMSPSEALTDITMEDIKTILSDYQLFYYKMGLEDKIRNIILNTQDVIPSQLYEYIADAPEAYIKLMEETITTHQCAAVITACRRRIHVHLPFNITTPCIQDALIETGTFSISNMTLEEISAIRDNEHVDTLCELIKIEDILSFNSHSILWFIRKSKLDFFEIYAEKFSEHPLYFGMICTPLIDKQEISNILLKHVIRGRFPLTRLHHYMYTEAYSWVPKNLNLFTPLNILKTISMDINSDRNTETILADGSILLIGNSVRKRMVISNVLSNIHDQRSSKFVSDKVYGIIINNIDESPQYDMMIHDIWREFAHVYVNVLVTNDIIVGVNFHRINVCLSAVNAIHKTLSDLLELMNNGLLYKLFDVPEIPYYEHVMSITAIDFMIYRPIKLSFDDFITLDDALINFSPYIVKTNMYLARVRIYAHFMIQYLLYVSILWFYYDNNKIQFSQILRSLCNLLAGTDLTPLRDDIFDKAASEMYMLYSMGTVCSHNKCNNNHKNAKIPNLDMLLSDVLSYAIQHRLSKCK
ncbi:hypothetical protein DP163_gp041 [Sea otter poxvirus]|uniref:Uncharacterized protein n=1 Tax=Sea otter poxvirus TaxID=1416741 RepID=A0A2U9QHM3_9POXV|nr:hypothetical protein DP163_gp041 [Sea otter poxvirus]AWU47086.1 hypothetical protein [Sea otter poxvirus]